MDENQVDNSVVNSVNPGTDAEKLLTQSQVNKIVQHEKAKAALAAQREAEDNYRREIAALQAKTQQQDTRNENVSREVDANAIYQQIQEKFNADLAKREQEFKQQQIQQEMNQVANSYLSKMQKGRDAYSDFDEVMKDFDPTAFPQLIYLVAGMDNAADIIYDLNKNPSKLANFYTLATTSPQKARAGLLELSNSITQNKQAQADAEAQQVAAPLDRLQPSRVSGSNGKMSVSDLRNQPWLRG